MNMFLVLQNHVKFGIVFDFFFLGHMYS